MRCLCSRFRQEPVFRRRHEYRKQIAMPDQKKIPRRQTTALALYSGGLDSTLACRVVAAQGIRVIALKFVSPFFGYDLLQRQAEHIREVKKKYDIDLRLVDITEDYLKLLGDPPHGYGKNFNPCIDCKILLLSKAGQMMQRYDASFLITGEVVGQRPMSQRRDTLRIIERDSGCEDVLVRPLCAKLLKPTKPEINDLIDREQLLALSGRTRVPQMELAERLGIKDYPSPAGGCILTDPIQSARIKQYYAEHEKIEAGDILFLLAGRQFRLPADGRVALGRNERENIHIAALQQADDYRLELKDRPGPTALLRHAGDQEDIALTAGLVVRYGKKNTAGPVESAVTVNRGGETVIIAVPPLADEIFKPWLR